MDFQLSRMRRWREDSVSFSLFVSWLSTGPGPYARFRSRPWLRTVRWTWLVFSPSLLTTLRVKIRALMSTLTVLPSQMSSSGHRAVSFWLTHAKDLDISEEPPLPDAPLPYLEKMKQFFPKKWQSFVLVTKRVRNNWKSNRFQPLDSSRLSWLRWYIYNSCGEEDWHKIYMDHCSKRIFVLSLFFTWQ